MSTYFTGVMSKKSTPSEVATDIKSKFDMWYNDLDELRDKASNYRKYYRGIPDKLPEWSHPDSPNYFVPYLETLVDTITAKFFLSLFAHDPIIRYNALDRKSVLPTRVTERIIHYYLNHRTPNVLTHLYLWVVDAILQGYGFLYVYWDKQTSGKTVSVPVPEEIEAELPEEEMFIPEGEAIPGPEGEIPGPEGEIPPPIDIEEELVKSQVQERTTYEGFQFSVLDVDDIAADFNESDINKTPVIVREYINPEVYLERMDSMDYEPLDEDQIEGAIVDYRGPTPASDDRDESETQIRQKLELLHYYGKGYLSGEDDDKLQDLKVTVLCNTTDPDQPQMTVKKTSLGFKPLCVIRFKPEKNRMDGRGVGDQCYDLNTELNINFNSRILNTSQALHRMYIIGINAGLRDKSQLISRPGGTVEVENINEIREMNHPPLQPEAFAHTRETIGYMEDVTAAQDIIQGKTSRQELATTATLKDSNAKQRLELHIFRMAKEGLSQLGDLLRVMLIEMHDPNDELTAILTKDEIEKFGPQLTNEEGGQSLVDEEGFMQVKVADLDGAMYADTEVSATDGDKRSVRQEMIQLLQMILQLMPNGNPTGEVTDEGKMVVEKVNVSRWIRELFRLWGRVDFKDFVQRLEVPIPPEVQQQTAGQQQPVSGQTEPPGSAVPPPAQEMQAMLDAVDQRMTTGGE